MNKKSTKHPSADTGTEGFVEKKKCRFVHKTDYYKTYMKTGKCDDRKCDGRHQKSCRYF